MGKVKKGVTLVELIVALSIFVLLFIAVYDLYMKNFSMYRESQEKSRVEVQVKNFSDSIYNYLKASYQNSIEVGTEGKFNNLEWKSADGKSGVEGEQEILFMVVPKKDDPVKYEFPSSIKLVSIQNGTEWYSYNGGILSEIASGKDVESFTDKYSYIMFKKKDDYIETISNITGELTTTKSLEGIVKNFSIKPKYTLTEYKLESIEVTIEYINEKNKPDIISYTIRK